jgi:hypothetical protein
MPSACLDSLYTDLHRRTAGIVPGHWRKVEAELAACDGLDALVALIRNGKRSDAVLGPLRDWPLATGIRTLSRSSPTR